MLHKKLKEENKYGILMHIYGIWRASQVVLMVKTPPVNAGHIRHTGLIPGLGRSPGGSSGVGCHPLQYACLENPVDRGAWWATVCGVTKSWTRLNQQHTGTVPIIFVGEVIFMWWRTPVSSLLLLPLLSFLCISFCSFIFSSFWFPLFLCVSPYPFFLTKRAFWNANSTA